MDIAVWGLFVSSFILGWLYGREHRKNQALHANLQAATQVIAARDKSLSERSEQYWRDQQQLDQNREYITKMQNECEQRDNTIAQLQSQVATLQSAQRIRDSNR